MDTQLIFYIDRLQKGVSEKFQESLPITFLEIKEDSLVFSQSISIVGEASIVDNLLLLQFSASTVASIPCRICNEWVTVPIAIENVYHYEELSSIKGGVFCAKELIRNELLVEVPFFAECNDGKCSGRDRLAHYFKKTDSEEEGYQPFKHL